MAIYGAGDAGGLVIRELLNQDADNRLVGFIDDDPRKAGIRVMGYPVLCGYSALSVLVHSNSVESIVVSVRNMPAERLNNLTTLCSEPWHLSWRVLPWPKAAIEKTRIDAQIRIFFMQRSLTIFIAKGDLFSSASWFKTETLVSSPRRASLFSGK